MAAHRHRRQKRSTPEPSVYEPGYIGQFPSDWYFARVLYPLLVPARDYVWAVSQLSFSFHGDLYDAPKAVLRDMVEIKSGLTTDTATMWLRRHMVRDEWNQLYLFAEPPDFDSWCTRLDGLRTAEDRTSFWLETVDVLLSIGEGNWCVYTEDQLILSTFVEACPELEARPIREMAIFH